MRGTVRRRDEEEDTMVRDLELFSKRARLNTPASATDIDEEHAPPPDTHSVTPEASTMGVIERVDMINFMCHRNLSISLGPRINFIIGHNGSGKSAILTAITVTLGGKAQTTSRGSSLKDFILEGAQAAEVRVRLRNSGSDAYRPDLYGNAINIERRIHSDGSGSWKIKNADGKTISTKREELDAICDHANIQVDNPMNILSQDAARQFLGSSQPEDKYSFFLRGTQLTQLAQEYELIQTNIQRMKRAIALTEDILPELERDAREANAKWRLIEQARAEQEKLDALKEELVWSQVIAKEKVRASLEEKLEHARMKQSAIQQRRDEDALRAKGLDDTVSEYEARSRESNEREIHLKEQRAQVTHTVKEYRASLLALKTRERELNEQADRVKQSIRQIQSQMDAEARRQVQDRHALRDAQTAERDERIRERLHVERQQLELSQADESLHTKFVGLRAERARLTTELHTYDDKISNLQRFVVRCNAAASNRVTAFGGPEITQVLSAINHETRWKERPYGPLGMHIRLRDRRWAPVIESVLADPLNAFVVTNHHDRALLSRILKTYHASNQIITAARDLFDYSHGEPEASVLTILRVLETDEHILRVLIDGHRIEKSALVPERVLGDQLMRRRLPNVLQCYSADLFKITGGATSSVTQTVTRYTGVPRFAADHTTELEEAQRAIAQHDASRSQIQSSLSELAEQETQLKSEQMRNQQQVEATRQEHRKLRQRIAQLEETMRDDEPANVVALEEARAEADVEMARIVERFKQTEGEKEAAEAALAPHAAKLDHLTEQIHLLEEHRKQYETELQKTYTERVRLQKTQEHWSRQLDAQEAIINETQRELASLNELIRSWTQMATDYCARVETQRTPASLEEQIRAIETQMQQDEACSGQSVEDVIRELRAKNKAYQEARQKLEQTHSTIRLLESAIQLRLEKWHYFRRFVAIRARANFSMHLQNRGFSGSLHFDHNAQTLKLRVQTGDSDKSHDKDPKVLSGGEKSFATICLLLSLWEAIGCPIRCLDEFDVFMDAVNRQVSMKMIVRGIMTNAQIDAARASLGVQYLLITPQNMSQVSLGPYVFTHSPYQRGASPSHAGSRATFVALHGIRVPRARHPLCLEFDEIGHHVIGRRRDAISPA